MAVNAPLFIGDVRPLGDRHGLDPIYIISINGKEAGEDVLNSIVEFTFEDAEKGMDTLDITIFDEGMKLIDDERLKRGNKVSCRFGYVGNMSGKRNMVIKEVSYSYAEDGGVTIKLTCFDEGHQLAGRKVKHTYKKEDRKIRFSEVVKEIATYNGLKADVIETKVEHREIKQSNKSDADFLKKWTKKCTPSDDRYTGGYTFFVENGVLFFIPEDMLNSKPPVYTFRYGYSGMVTDKLAPALSVDIMDSHEEAKQATDLRQSGIDPRGPEIIDDTFNDDNTGTQKLGDGDKKEIRIYGENARVEEVRVESGDTNTALGAQDKLPGNEGDGTNKTEAEAELKENEFEGLEVSITSIGIPQLAAKKIYLLEGLGKRMSGRYRATKVRHNIGDSGYDCELDLVRNAETSKDDKSVGEKSKVNEQPVTPEKQVVSMEHVSAETGETLE